MPEITETQHDVMEQARRTGHLTAEQVAALTPLLGDVLASRRRFDSQDEALRNLSAKMDQLVSAVNTQTEELRLYRQAQEREAAAREAEKNAAERAATEAHKARLEAERARVEEAERQAAQARVEAAQAEQLREQGTKQWQQRMAIFTAGSISMAALASVLRQIWEAWTGGSAP